MIKVIGFILMLLFLGCSYKINPNEFAPINAKKSKILPSKQEIYSKTQILIITPKKTPPNIQAKSAIESLLSSNNSVIILNRKFNSIEDEIKLAEEAKKSKTNLNQANYIVEVAITSGSTSTTYHPPVYWRDKKGKIHKTPAYYSHRACVGGYIKIIKIPEQITTTLPLYDCESENTQSRYYNFDYLINSAIKEAIFDKKDDLYEIFAKRGYVFEIRKKDDTTILHTTLGSEFGAKEGEVVNIYTLEVKKEPFSNKEKIIQKKIGEGVISDKIEPDSSWIIVKKAKEPIKIGDFVKINYHYSIFERIKDIF
jgi:hypothetical protein